MSANDTSGPDETVPLAVENVLPASAIGPALAVVVEVLVKIAGDLAIPE